MSFKGVLRAEVVIPLIASIVLAAMSALGTRVYGLTRDMVELRTGVAGLYELIEITEGHLSEDIRDKVALGNSVHDRLDAEIRELRMQLGEVQRGQYCEAR